MEMVTTKTTFQKYSAYKNSGEYWLGEVPKDWELTRLGTRFLERRSKVSDKDFPPLSVTKNGIVPQLSNAAKSNDGDNRKLVREGDFVINSRSDRKGSSGIAKEDGSVSLINIVMIPKGIEPMYCNFLLKSTAFVEENYRIGHGIVADLWTTRYDEMKNIKVAIPSYPEQTAIANFLDDKTAKIDQAIAQKEKMIALLKERKQIIIQNSVTKGLDPNVKMKDSGVEWIGEIPEHWEVKRLKTEVNLLTGFPFESSKYKESGIKLARGINVKEGVFNWKETRYWHEVEKHLEPFILKENDVLIGMDGSKVGKNFCIVRSEDLPVLLLQRVARLRAKNTLNAKFLYYNLMNPSFLFWVNLSKTDPMVPHISPANINDFLIALPPIKEQNLIVKEIDLKLDEMMKAISQQQTQIEKLKEYKATLIDSAVTGKIKVS